MAAQFRHATFAEVKAKIPGDIYAFEMDPSVFFIVTSGSFMTAFPNRQIVVGDIFYIRDTSEEYAHNGTFPGDEAIGRPVVTSNGVEQYSGQATSLPVWGFAEG